MGSHAADPVLPGANEGAPLLRGTPSKSPTGKAIASARHALTAPVTFVVFLAAVTFVGLGFRISAFSLDSASGHFGEGAICTFSQLNRGLRMVHRDGGGSLGAVDADLSADAASPRGLLYSKPGAALPFSQQGNGFKCGPEYDTWLQNTALYTPDKCELLTPGANASPFAGTGVRKILVVGNSYMFQQISALVSQYEPHVDMLRSPSMIQYWPSLSGEQRCACVRDDAPVKQCVDMFSRSRWENLDGTATAVANFKGGDGFYEGMQGPPSTMGVYRFKDGTEMYAMTNHPLMNSNTFGLGAMAKALGVNLYELDAIYMNYGNYRGFGKLFCGGQVDNDVVKNGVGELDDAHVRQALMDGGFKGKLLLTTKTATEDLASEFTAMLRASAMGQTPWNTLLVPFHMHLSYQMCPYVAGDGDDSCKGQLGCGRKTCDIHNMAGCTGGEGHACAPGLADVSVNLLLHALRADVIQYFWGSW
jgi:hypothetical protein